MIATRLYRDGKLLEENFDPARISDELPKHGTLVWLDAEDPAESEISLVEEEFSIHPLAAEDVRHRDQRTKIELYEAEGFSFIVLHAMALPDGELVDQEVHVFVGAGYLVTFRYPPAYPMAAVTRRWDRQAGLASEGAGFFLYGLLDEIVDGYFEVVERLEDESEALEELVFSEESPEDLQERIFLLRKKVLEFRRWVMPLREVLELIQKETGLATDRIRAYYRDVADHVYRVLELIDLLRELMTTALEALLSQVSNRLNLVMKQLTSWAAIILVPTLIAGIYGMNFRSMPELLWRYGYAWALGLMAVSGGILYAVFKRRGWL